jgi:hypothetical protein
MSGGRGEEIREEEIRVDKKRGEYRKATRAFDAAG